VWLKSLDGKSRLKCNPHGASIPSAPPGEWNGRLDGEKPRTALLDDKASPAIGPCRQVMWPTHQAIGRQSGFSGVGADWGSAVTGAGLRDMSPLCGDFGFFILRQSRGGVGSSVRAPRAVEDTLLHPLAGVDH
jgi:hypothetical protein